MITKVCHGDRLRGLMEYLFGKGRFDQHQDPHFVAGWDEKLLAEPRPGKCERGLLVDEIEFPMRMFDTEVSMGDVYHVPIAVHLDDKRLPDAQWREIAERAVEKLGLSATADRAGCRWFAVHHGPSANGNDHIHLVVSLVREDGTVPDMRGDFTVWSEFRSEMEQRYGLTATRSKGAGMPGLQRGELAKAERLGRHETERETLARVTRAAAMAARGEGEFVGRLRRKGVLIRPRWAPGGRTEVVGYSVALRPEPGKDPIWFGGGKLADDLTLADVRARWRPPTPEQAAEALRSWRPPGWRQLPTGKQVWGERLAARGWGRAAEVVAETRTKLSMVTPGDAAGWAGVAAEAAGSLSALATRLEPGRVGPLSRAADALARAAQTERRLPSARRSDDMHSLSGVARVAGEAILASQGGPMAVAVLVGQLVMLVREIQRANEMTGRVAEAAHAVTAAREMLDFVAEVTAARTANIDGRAALRTPQRVTEASMGQASRTITPILGRGGDRER